MSENIEQIKNFNIGDRVTSRNTILLDRGFTGVTGTIRTIVKDEVDSWQYLIDLDDGRELQCDDWHLEKPTSPDLENLSDIKELLECALYQPSSSSEIEGYTQAALDSVNKMIGEWSE